MFLWGEEIMEKGEGGEVKEDELAERRVIELR